MEKRNVSLTPYEHTQMILPFEPRGSSFIPSSNTMYYYIHILDEIVDKCYSNHTWWPKLYWHPYCSRIYFGQLFCIQVARCMEEAGVLSTEDSVFLEYFLKKYPLDTLIIPGPLIPLFRSICCSSSQPLNLQVYPTLAESSDLHRRTPEGAPLPVPSSWLIPNIPELIGLANRLCSQEARNSLAAGNFKSGYKYNPLERLKFSETSYEDKVIINGYNWTQQAGRSAAEKGIKSNQDSPDSLTESDNSKKQSNHADETQSNSMSGPSEVASGDELRSAWYFATPGLAYQLECSKEIEERFIENGHKLQLPIFTESSSFDTLEKFLGLKEVRWFSALSQIMSDYSRLFKSSGNLSQCPVNGPEASQVIIQYTRPEEPLKKPKFPGDSSYDPCFYFEAHSNNLELSDEAAQLGFYSQLNTLYWPEHPFMSSIHDYERSHMTGPYWQSSTLERRSNRSSGYLFIPRAFSSTIVVEQGEFGRNQFSLVNSGEKPVGSQEVNAKSGSNSNVNLEEYHELLKPYSFNIIRMAPPPYAAKSSFIPNSNVMYYYIHILDDLLFHHFDIHRPGWIWHPYCSRIYFGILFCIQVARCMREVRVLSFEDSEFLEHFLTMHPLETLKIPGPLMPLFQSICCSSVEPYNFKIYPTLPKSSDLHRRTPEGAPSPAPSSWLIPNIPELIGLANRLCSQEVRNSLAAGNSMDPYRYNPLERFGYAYNNFAHKVIINGYNWARQQASGDEPRSPWYFATPGLAYQLECSTETTKNFINHAHRLELPEFTANSKFDTLEKFLGLEKTRWFKKITEMMSDYSRSFKEHGDLSQCPVNGPGASQIIIRYTQPHTSLSEPKFPGDEGYSPSFYFRAHTINLGLTEKVEQMGFFSQLNTLYRPDHPFMGSIQNCYQGSYMTGPFWQSSTIEKTSNHSTGYSLIPTIFSNSVKFLED